MTASKKWPQQIDGRNLESVLTSLRRPFVDEEVYWRVQSMTKNGSAQLLAYLDSRCIQERLDDVVGPANWQIQIRVEGNKTLGGIGINIAGEWVWKWDGAGDTKVEAEKGGISGAIKRSAVLWGMGRHLYELGRTYAKPHQNKPGGIPEGRLVWTKGGYCVAPSIREVQGHLMSVEDLVRHIPDAKSKRLMRFKVVASKSGIQSTGPQIQALVEAATAKYKDGKFTSKGAPHPSKASDKQIEIGSHRVVKWHEDGVVKQMVSQYWKDVGNADVPF